MRIKAYSDGQIFFDTNLEKLSIIKPKIEQEVNKVGKFTFSIYPDHPYYDIFVKMKSIITVYEDGISEPLFRGRIFDEQAGFYNEKQISCEGELAFLNDSIQRPWEFTGTPEELFAQFINNHNAQVDASRQFKVGRVTVTDPNDYITRADSKLTKTWKCIEDKLIKGLGGYLWVRHEEDGNYIDYLKDFTVLSNQAIQFGKNLLDLKKKVKANEFATAIIPQGAYLKDAEGNDTEERLNIKDVNNGVDYVYNAEAVAVHDYIFTTQIWEDVTDATNLKRKAQEYIDNMAQFTASIDVSAADLNGATVDGKKVSVNSFRIGRYVKVETKPHGLEQNFLVNKLTRELLNPEKTKLVLGATYKSLTERTANANSLKGEKGSPGTPGKDGKGVASSVVAYQASTSGTTAPTGTWSSTIPTVADNQYLWTRTVITYTDDTTSTLYSIGKMGADGKDGEDGAPGKDGKGISSVTEYYAVSDSNTTAPTTWQNTVPTMTATNKYMWNYESITYTDSTTFDTKKRVIGVYGDKGDEGSPGAAGNGIKTITNYYLASASLSGVTTSTSGWTTTIQTITASKKYLWNYEVVTYTNNSTSTTAPVIIGVYGNTGAAGKDAAVQSVTVPSDTSYMWLDISVEPALIKWYNSTTSTWEAINDTTAITDSIVQLQENVYADISKSADEILATVSESYSTIGDVERLVSETKTEFEQTAEDFEMRFTSFEADLADVVAGTDAEFTEIKKYIRFVDGKILLGEVGNQLELQISNEKISFIQDNAEVAYFSDRKLYVTDGEYTNSLQLGSFAFIPRSNKNLSFKKIT